MECKDRSLLIGCRDGDRKITAGQFVTHKPVIKEPGHGDEFSRPLIAQAAAVLPGNGGLTSYRDEASDYGLGGIAGPSVVSARGI